MAARLEIDSWRWAGVPWYIRVGKALRESATEAVIEFRAAADAVRRVGGPPPDAT
jgi:glucose-6-phosphate 1-dehydrogenase